MDYISEFCLTCWGYCILLYGIQDRNLIVLNTRSMYKCTSTFKIYSLCITFYGHVRVCLCILFSQNSMVNQPQGHNSMDSSAALLQQQQHNFDVQVSASYTLILFSAFCFFLLLPHKFFTIRNVISKLLIKQTPKNGLHLYISFCGFIFFSHTQKYPVHFYLGEFFIRFSRKEREKKLVESKVNWLAAKTN